MGKKAKTEEAAPAKPNIFTKLLNGGKAVTIGIVVAVIVVVLGGIYFTTGSPKVVVKNLINKGYNEAHKNLKEVERLYNKYDFKKPFKASFDVTVESDMEEFKDISGIKMSGEVGYDLDQKIVVGSVALENKEKIDVSMAIDEDKVYLKFLDEVIDLSEDAGIDPEIFEEIAAIAEEYDLDFKTYDNLLKSLKNALQKSVDPKALKKSRDKISVGGKDISVNKISYTLDEDSVQYLVENFSKTLLKDKNFEKSVEKLLEEYEIDEIEYDDIEELLEELEDSASDIELDKSDKVVVNIYTKGVFNKVVGVSVVYDKKEFLTYVDYGKYKQLVVDDHDSEKLVVTAEKKGKETEVTVKLNKEKIATATVRKFDEHNIDLDYTIDVEGEKVKGSIYFTAKEEKKSVSGDYKFSIDAGDELNFKVSGSYSMEFDADVEVFSTKNAKTPDEIDPEELEEKLEKKLAKDEALKDLIEGALEDYEEEAIEYNYIGMIPVEEDEAVKLLTRSRPTVLYVGDTYYSRYYEEDYYNLLSNLEDAQDDMGFHSYYLDDYYADEAFEAAVKDVEYTCVRTPEEGTTTEETPAEPQCEQYPTVYLIKDGKVVKALRGLVTAEDYEKYLGELGI